jgi:hypothetical protein
MAKRLFFASQSFTAQAYAATVLTGGTYMAALGGNTTQMTDVLELLISGMQSASTVAAMQLVRSSGAVAATPAALVSPNSDGPMVPATAALTAALGTFVSATTNPQASATITDAKLNLALNAFGGIIRWNAAPTQQWQMLGSATGFGVSVLFNSTVSGGTTATCNAHWIYETY